MIKSNIKGMLIGIVIGVVTCGTVVYATGELSAGSIDFTPSNDNWENITNVEEALDSLYTKVKPAYTGATTVTPGPSSQTLQTNGKVLNDNITVNAIPSTYKPLTGNTSGLAANKILSGYNAYNSAGNLISGNITTYNGTTLVTPSSTAQTLQTSGKYVDNNIVVSAISLSADTTGLAANTLLNGIIAYNNQGQTVTGNIETYSGTTTVTPTASTQTLQTNGKYLSSNITINGADCISGTYHHNSNTQLSINFGINYNRFILNYAISGDSKLVYYNGTGIYYYSAAYTENSVTVKAWTDAHTGTTFTHTANTTATHYTQSYDVNWIACK